METKDSKKELILKHAEMLFGTKGFSETKIADISTLVGISDSTIYEHFANKQDILFALPRERAKEWRKSNIEHLRGLVGAEVKLRKLVWNYMDYYAKSKEWANIALFALTPNREFFHSESHKEIRKAMKLYREVIVEGQQNGEFEPGISPSLILYLIMGTIHQIAITWLAENNPKNPFDLFEDFFDLFIHSLQQKKMEPIGDDKKEKIMNAALKIFTEIGYQKARIQDIARLAGVADGTIYKFFNSKDDILFSLTLEKSKEWVATQKRHLAGDVNLDFKLTLLLRDYISWINTEKEYGVLLHFDLRYNWAFYQTEVYQFSKEFTRMFYDIIKEGIASNHYRQGINPIVALMMILGIFDQMILSRLMFGHPENFTALSDSICELILKSIKP